MFKLNRLSAAILFSTGSLGAVEAAAQQEPPIVEEVMVTGIRGSINRAIDLKRDSDVLQDSIVAEDIGKFPDQNVAESLQRITGVSISRAGGEGAQITVRSFGPEFNIVKFNDRTLATTTGGRSFDFQLLPSELISGADVIKTPTADLSAGSIGAYINVRSPRPLDDPGFNAVGAIKTNYQDTAEEFSPELSGLVSNTFADDTIGVSAGLSYKESETRLDSYRATIWNQYAGSGFGFIPGSVGEDGQPLVDADGQPTTDMPGSYGPGRTIYTMANEKRERIGATAVIQWEPNSNFSNTLDFLYTELQIDRLGGGLQIPNQQTSKYTRAVVSDSGTLLEATIADTDIEMSVDTALAENSTSAMGLNSVFTEGALTLEFDASYSKAEGDWEGDNSSALHHTFFAEDGSLTPNTSIILDYSTDVPGLTTTGGLDITDPSKVRAAWQHYGASDVEDEITELKMDAMYEIDAGVVRSVKGGAAYTDRTVAFNEYGTEFDPETGNESWPWPGAHEVGQGSTWGTDPTIGEVPDSIFSLNTGYMDGISGNFPREWVQINNWAAYAEAGQAAVEAVRPDHPLVQAGWDTVYKSAGSYENSEETMSLYAMVNLEGELGDYLWSGNAGVRYVDIDRTASGRASTISLLRMDPESTPPPIINTADSEFLAPRSETTTEEHFLPSINLKLDLNGGHIVRTAASKTIALPNMLDAGVNYTESPSVEAPLVRISGGNPDLESYEVTAFDLGYEFYSDDDNAVSVAYFYKDITSFISTINMAGPWDGPVDPALEAAYAEQGQVVRYESNRKENRPGGVVQGLELGALYYFPGLMDGFGVQANYTYSDSEDKEVAPLNQPLVPEPGSGVEGFAKHSYNVIGFYDKDAFQARIAYNWRDSFMSSRSGGDMSLPLYTDEYGQLDASVSWDFTENLTVLLEGINLTNETRLGYIGQRDRVTLVEMTGTRYMLGLRARF